MFTGIIEKVGTIKSIADNKNASREFIVSVDDMFEDINKVKITKINGSN